MKRLLFTFLFALLSAAPVLATTVTISAYSLQNLPFNPANVGSDRSIAVTATNGSATITSNQLFPANIVGVAGFQVLIDGTQYVVASVQSTSSLTLTTNYGGTSGAQTMLFYKYVLFRAYATAGFQDNVTGQNIQPGAPGSGNFYKQVAVSIINSGAGNVAYIPEFTMPSTTDALLNASARYQFGFYTTSNAFLAFYQCGAVVQLALQPNTPTTWTAICNYNAAGPPPPPPNTYYTTGQIDQRFPNCSQGQLYYFAANGNILSCLSLGTNLSITSATLNAAGGGAGSLPAATFTSVSYPALTTDWLISVDASSATRTVTLYSASGNTGKLVSVCKRDTSVNTTIISDGSSVLGTIYMPTSCLQFTSNGSAWVVQSY